MKKLLIITILLTVFIVTGCTLANFKKDINKSSNVPKQATAIQLITNSELSLGSLTSRPEAEYVSQYLGQLTYVENSLYPQGLNSDFSSFYEGPLNDLETVIDKRHHVSEVTPNEIAIAKILKAYYFWNMTDRWGAIPYTDALRGIENITPAYTPQKMIYDSLFVLLKDAGNEINTSQNVQNDIIYDGNMKKWKKLSDSIRLLMALRLSKIDPARGKKEFNEAIKDGVMASNNNSFVFQNLKNTDVQSYWYEQVHVEGRIWWALSKGLVGLMKPVSDPRLPIYGNRAKESGEFVGIKYGETQDVGPSVYSVLGDAITKQDAPIYLVTYPEILFAKAEAAEHGWIPGGDAEAKKDYQLAIKNSILQWTGSTKSVNKFLNQQQIAFDSSKAIDQIITQRYVHLFMNGYEAWSVWRRTGYPDIMLNPLGHKVPRRLRYPSNEKFNNKKHFEEALQKHFNGENSLYGRIWWDPPK